LLLLLLWLLFWLLLSLWRLSGNLLIGYPLEDV
jgi:hypothetical protein